MSAAEHCSNAPEFEWNMREFSGNSVSISKV